ncbi:MAG: TIGR00341 family protein [Phycisphaerales bacterium]
MANRLVEIMLPSDRLDAAREHIAADGPTELWTSSLDDGLSLLRVIVAIEATEALLDRLAPLTKLDPPARIVVLPVEVSLPRPEEAKPPDPPEAPEEKPKRAPLRISREELYEDLNETARLSSVYITLVVLSTIVAAIGLTRDGVAIVIGAMVLAPLLGPNMALALATTIADPKLGGRSIVTNATGLVVALALSIAFGFTLPFDPDLPEIASRASVGIADALLAIAAGAAGALAFTSGAASSLVGVMVAVALLPPLVAVGLFLGAGHFELAWRATHLLAINVVGVNLAAVAVFLVMGLGPRSYWRKERARRMALIAWGIWALLFAALIALLALWRR